MNLFAIGFLQNNCGVDPCLFLVLVRVMHMRDIRSKLDRQTGRDEASEKFHKYIRELANHVDEKDASDLPGFLRVLADRIEDGSVP